MKFTLPSAIFTLLAASSVVQALPVPAPVTAPAPAGAADGSTPIYLWDDACTENSERCVKLVSRTDSIRRHIHPLGRRAAKAERRRNVRDTALDSRGAASKHAGRAAAAKRSDGAAGGREGGTFTVERRWQQRRRKPNKVGGIVGGVIAGVVVLVFALVLIRHFLIKRRMRKAAEAQQLPTTTTNFTAPTGNEMQHAPAPWGGAPGSNQYWAGAPGPEQQPWGAGQQPWGAGQPVRYSQHHG